MKLLLLFLAFLGALTVLHFVFSVVSLWAVAFGIVSFFVGYTLAHSKDDA